MKKPLLIIVGFVVAVGLIGAAHFWWKNLRGIGPALAPVSGDIAAQLETVPKPMETGTSTWGMANPAGLPLTLPSGFQISVFAKELGGPRVLAFDPKGVLLTSISSKGKVVALPDRNSDGVADEVVTVVERLDRPHGLAFRCEGERCTLYVAESGQVATYDYDATTFKATNKQKIIDLPAEGGHWTRTLLFYNDRLFIAIGSSCNVCVEEDDKRAKIFSAHPDGSDLKEYARGLRNSVFLTVHPTTGKIWATEMGRDLLGDNTPPEEINVIEEGKNYGWPICYGKNIHDTEFDKNTYIRNPCQEPFETPSTIDMQAHSAPLGLAFVPSSWPEEFRDDLLVGFHGSWNRAEPTGYKIARLKLDANGSFQGQEDFISGWLTKDGKALGRPVDVVFHEQDLFISDDKAGIVYRVAYQKQVSD